MKRYCASVGLVIAALWLGVPACIAADYERPVSYAKGKPIEFRDFRLVFKGTREVNLPLYPRGFTYYDFTATAGDESVEISWSAGTGDIAPVRISVAGGAYFLELGHSSAGAERLKDRELIVWPETKYHEAMARRRAADKDHLRGRP